MKKLSNKKFEKIYIAEFFNGRSSQEALSQIEQENVFQIRGLDEGIQTKANSSNQERPVD